MPPNETTIAVVPGRAPVTIALPSPAVTLKWQSTTQDGSSNVTGSSVFDFEGDGKAEVVYNDECYFRVYNGADGMVLFETPSSSKIPPDAEWFTLVQLTTKFPSPSIATAGSF